MSEKLYLTGSISVGRGKKGKEKIGAGTKVTSIDWPDKKYGIGDKDLERMLRSGSASFDSSGDFQAIPAQKINITVDQKRLAAFSKAIALLESSNEGHWNQGGAPEVSALKEQGFETTVEERDAVWGILEPLLG